MPQLSGNEPILGLNKLLRYMLYDGKGLWKRNQVILSPNVVEKRVKHEDMSFDGRGEKATESNITFVKENDILELDHL
jgi:hypothetical protein